MGSSLSNGAATGSRRWPWHYPVELERGYTFFLHQRSGDDFSGASKGDRDCRRTVSSSVLDHRSSPPCYRISQGCKGAVGGNRNSSGKLKLFYSAAAGVGRPGSADARSPAY